MHPIIIGCALTIMRGLMSYALLEPDLALHGIRRILFNNPKCLEDAFSREFAKAIEFFNHPSFNIAQYNIALYTQQVDQIDQQREDFYTSKSMLCTYLAHLNNKDLGFLPQEVCLAAQALGIGVQVIQKNIDSTITLIQEVKMEQNTCPVLFYQNGHYFRCLLKT